MTWNRKEGEYQDPPLGTHLARCVGVIDLGTQTGEWQGSPLVRRQNIIRWELPTELMDDGRPFVVLKFYTTSLNEKSNLYGDLVNWRGREFTDDELAAFDERNLLDKVCQVSITKNTAGKARVSGVFSPAKGMTCPPRANPLVYLSLEPGAFDREAFEGLSDGIKNIIRRSPEFEALHRPAKAQAAAQGAGIDHDDIPF